MLLHFGFSIAIIRVAGRIAHYKVLVSGDLEYSVHSSIVLVCSVEQVVASFVAVWLIVTGAHWAHGFLDFLSGSCYIVGLIFALAAGYLAADTTARHLSSNSDELVRSSKFQGST